MDVPRELVEMAERTRPLFERVKQVAAFDYPAETAARFKALHEAITASPLPPLLARLTRECGSRRDWFSTFKTSALHNVQEGFAATYYHLVNLESIEREVCSILRADVGDLRLPRGAAAGGGNTRRLSFEYESFLFDIRRTLEYFAASVGAFFKTDCIRIRDICAAICSRQPSDVRERVVGRIDAAKQGLSDLIPPETRGARDVIAHWKPLRAGTFNVSRQIEGEGYRFGFFSGDQELGPWDSRTSARIVERSQDGNVIGIVSPPLRDQVRVVEEMIFGVYKDMGLLP